MSNFLIISPNRVGSTIVQSSLEHITGVRAQSHIFADTFIQDSSKLFRTFLRLANLHYDELILKIHPHMFFNHRYTWEEMIMKMETLFNRLSNSKRVYILRKNIYDAVLSANNIKLIEKDKGSMAWIEPYKPVTDSITSQMLNTAIIDYFITVQLANRQKVPIFWYEDLFNDDPDALVPLFEYLGFSKDVIDENIINLFSTKNRLRL